MALIKTSSDIISIHGRFGGVYFKRGSDGQHIQAMPRVWNYTRSAAQQGSALTWNPGGASGIRGYSSVSVLWHLALLTFFVASWVAFAAAAALSKKDDKENRISGFNWYMYYALKFPECVRPPFWKPPHAVGELPNFMAVYEGPYTYRHKPEDWPGDCGSDYYWEGIEHNGKPSYHNDDLTWFLWWKANQWVFSQGLDFEDPQTTFYSPTPEITGRYKNPVTNKRTNLYWGRSEEIDLPH